MNAKLGQEATFFHILASRQSTRNCKVLQKKKKIFYPDAASLLHK